MVISRAASNDLLKLMYSTADVWCALTRMMSTSTLLVKVGDNSDTALKGATCHLVEVSRTICSACFVLRPITLKTVRTSSREGIKKQSAAAVVFIVLG